MVVAEMNRTTFGMEGATGETMTPSCHNGQGGDVTYFAFFSSSLSGTAPVLLTECLTMISAGVTALS
jgi:hypothetical protein